MGKRRVRKARRIIAAAAVITSLVAGGLYYRQTNLASAKAEEPTVQTTSVRTGDMVITLSGAGTIVPSQEVEVGFDTVGRVSEVLVDVGDWVEAGDVLARLDARDAEVTLREAEINLQLAQIELAELNEAASDSDLAAAEAALAMATEELADLQAGASSAELAAARATLATAQETYAELAAGPSAATIASAEASLQKATLALQQAQVAYADSADDTESAAAALAAYQEALLEHDVAQVNYAASMEGASASELQAAAAAVSQAQSSLSQLLTGASAAELASAEAAVKTAQANLDEMLSGPTESQLAVATLSVQQAEIALDDARDALAAVELKAPIAGVVTAVDTAVGLDADGSSVFSLADMNVVQVLFYVDETDVSLLATGQGVSVVLDALPDVTFSGQVVRIYPTLTEVSGVPVATVLASLEIPEGNTSSLLADMSATVEVIAADHQDVVVVAVEAVHKGSDGQYLVSVVGRDGAVSTRTVEVGLSDDVNYEVLSGLEAGETVAVGTSSGATVSAATAAGQAPVGVPQGDIGFDAGGMPPMG